MSSNLYSSSIYLFVPDSKLDDQTCSTTGKEVTGSRSAYTTNGFPSSAPRLAVVDLIDLGLHYPSIILLNLFPIYFSVSAQLGTEETTVVNGEINPISSSHEKIVTNLLVEESYELQKDTTIDLSKNNENDIVGTKDDDPMLLNEASVEVPKVNENDIDGTKDNDSAASGSQNSWSMPDELSQELTQPQPKLKSTAPAKDSSIVEKPKATRLTRYNRRGRQRGK